MALPEFTKKLIETKLQEYCNRKIPVHARDQIKLIFNIRGSQVTLTESRPYHMNPSIWTKNPVAKFRYDNLSGKWTLCWPDRNTKWHVYNGLHPSANIDDLLREIDRDPTGIFWG